MHDAVVVTVAVPVPPVDAFALFTRDIDAWWQRGPRFRASGVRVPSRMLIEERIGGRLLEHVGEGVDVREVVFGEVTQWQPPDRFVLRWRNTNFAPDEHTLVSVEFRAVAAGTHVRVTHAGWTQIRADHPTRHGAEPRQFIDQLGRWWGLLLAALRARAGSD